jgi:hypothetical protein
MLKESASTPKWANHSEGVPLYVSEPVTSRVSMSGSEPVSSGVPYLSSEPCLLVGIKDAKRAMNVDSNSSPESKHVNI